MTKRGGYPYEDDSRCHWCDTRTNARGHICTDCRKALDEPSPEITFRAPDAGARVMMSKAIQVDDIVEKIKKDAGDIPVGTQVKVTGVHNNTHIDIKSIDGKDIPGKRGSTASWAIIGSYQVVSSASSQPKSGNSHPPIGTRWIKKKDSAKQGPVEVTGHDMNYQGARRPSYVQYRYESGTNGAGHHTNGGLDSTDLKNFHTAFEPVIDSYPPIGSKWIKKGSSQSIMEVVGHNKTMLGNHRAGSIQYKYQSGKNSSGSAKDGGLDSVDFAGFHGIFERYDNLCSTSSRSTSKSRTNDGRDTCYSCGAPTYCIGCMPSSTMMQCTKCGR